MLYKSVHVINLKQVCNNLKKCHCDFGWSGPDCSLQQDQPFEHITSSTEIPLSPSSKNKMEKKETPYGESNLQVLMD